ncbi:MAG TPA: alpha/beta hydrolase [Alphaproteobacteria bacterium]|jgi:acetyl esterase/lipase|nr:alpha/beta hydrolase [Alphaproteobacteria bacterium]
MRLLFAVTVGISMAFLGALNASAQEQEPPLPPGARELRNLEFAKPDGVPLHLDLYLPTTSRAAPLVIWVHGGGWADGSKEDPPGLSLLEHGYALATVEYRLTDRAAFPAQIHDVKAAVRFLRANAARFGLDPNRFGAWGESAGGHLVALLGTTSVHGELEGDEGVTGVSSRVQAVCDWYGPTDLLKINSQMPDGADNYDDPDSPVSLLLGGPAPHNRKKARQANPIKYVTWGTPPFFILHGDADDTVPVEQSKMLVHALKRAGVDVQFTLVEDGGHSGPAYFTPERLAEVRKFFDRHLKRAGRS